mmetsp:Transcript_52465/g.78393  ORF Transcript_52465/g.78393 Transcript_52465/m.78393 type:complete len:362 (-) Transcript_52465:173-1258(-)
MKRSSLFTMLSLHSGFVVGTMVNLAYVGVVEFSILSEMMQSDKVEDPADILNSPRTLVTLCASGCIMTAFLLIFRALLLMLTPKNTPFVRRYELAHFAGVILAYLLTSLSLWAKVSQLLDGVYLVMILLGWITAPLVVMMIWLVRIYSQEFSKEQSTTTTDKLTDLEAPLLEQETADDDNSVSLTEAQQYRMGRLICTVFGLLGFLMPCVSLGYSVLQLGYFDASHANTTDLDEHQAALSKLVLYESMVAALACCMTAFLSCVTCLMMLLSVIEDQSIVEALNQSFEKNVVFKYASFAFGNVIGWAALSFMKIVTCPTPSLPSLIRVIAFETLVVTLAVGFHQLLCNCCKDHPSQGRNERN